MISVKIKYWLVTFLLLTGYNESDSEVDSIAELVVNPVSVSPSVEMLNNIDIANIRTLTNNADYLLALTQNRRLTHF